MGIIIDKPKFCHNIVEFYLYINLIIYAILKENLLNLLNIRQIVCLGILNL